VLDVSGRLTPQQFLPKPPAPLTLRPQAQGLSCLLDAAWSPQCHVPDLGNIGAGHIHADLKGPRRMAAKIAKYC